MRIRKCHKKDVHKTCICVKFWIPDDILWLTIGRFHPPRWYWIPSIWYLIFNWFLCIVWVYGVDVMFWFFCLQDTEEDEVLLDCTGIKNTYSIMKEIFFRSFVNHSHREITMALSSTQQQKQQQYVLVSNHESLRSYYFKCDPCGIYAFANKG